MANEADLLKRNLDEVVEGRRSLGEGIEGVQNRLDSFRDETFSNFDGVLFRLEHAESEIQAISAALARLESMAERERPARDLLRLEIERLKERPAILEKRLRISTATRPNRIEGWSSAAVGPSAWGQWGSREGHIFDNRS